MHLVVLALTIIASVFSIYTRYRNEELYALTKPIPLFLIIALYVVNIVSMPPVYFFTLVILLGLVAGVIGDILLLSSKRFLAGLVVFLLGHILYIVAFATKPFSLPPYLIVVPFVITISYGVYLLRKMKASSRKKYAVPILIYLVTITIMYITALNFDMHSPRSGLPLFTLGALLFCISDGVLAWNKFYKPFRTAEGIILTTYYTAQMLIGFKAMCFIDS